MKVNVETRKMVKLSELELYDFFMLANKVFMTLPFTNSQERLVYELVSKEKHGLMACQMVTPLKKEEVDIMTSAPKIQEKTFFDQIKIGSFFEYNGVVYLKLSNQRNGYNVFDIQRNTKAEFPLTEEVTALYQMEELRLRERN
jgi:hypothetical protein